MPKFTYTAIAKTGEKVKGSQEAKDERALARQLSQQGYIVTTAKTNEGKKILFSFKSFLSFRKGVSLVDKLLFTRNLQVMVAAGTPLPKALEILAEQARSKSFAGAIRDIRTSVIQGKPLSEAMGAYPKIFSELFVNMITVGEESGTLENVLSHLSLQLEREHEIRSRVLGALLYPAIIVVAMLGIGTLMLAVVVPQLASVFEDLGVDLPLTTRIIIALGSATATYWFFVLPGIVVFLGVLFRLSKTTQGKRVVDALVLRAPVLSGIIRKTNAALLTRTLSSLIAAGVPIVKAIQITSHVLGNVYFQESLRTSADKVGKGAKFSEALQEYRHLYPIVVIQMISVGEETGETGSILSKLAEFYEAEVENVTKNLASVIEPVLMLAIGAAVGFFAVSMIQPMYSMLGSIQ